MAGCFGFPFGHGRDAGDLCTGKALFGAEYFTPLFDTEWVRTFLDQGIFAGIKYVLWRLYHVGLNFFALLWQGLTKDLFWGEYFAAFMIVMLVILLQTAVYWFRRKEKWNQLLLHTYLSLCFVGMWAALLLMYKMKEGSKHLLTFLAVGIFAISLMETRFYKKTVAVAAVFAIVFVISGTDPYEHQIPFRQEELAAQEGYWQDIFAEECTLERDQVPSFENVMIWVFNGTDSLSAAVPAAGGVWDQLLLHGFCDSTVRSAAESFPGSCGRRCG